MFHMDAAHVSHGTPRMFLQSLESANNTLYTGAYGESWSPRCLLVSVDLLAALGAIRAAQRQSAKNF